MKTLATNQVARPSFVPVASDRAPVVPFRPVPTNRQIAIKLRCVEDTLQQRVSIARLSTVNRLRNNSQDSNAMYQA